MLITLRDQLKQQFSTSLAERHEAKFVKDQKFVADHLFLQPQKPALSLASISSRTSAAGIAPNGRKTSECRLPLDVFA
jgi:hypothetical protein